MHLQKHGFRTTSKLYIFNQQHKASETEANKCHAFVNAFAVRRNQNRHPLSFKTTINQKIRTAWTVKRISLLSLLVFRFKSFFGFRTRGLTQFHSLALNKLLEQLPKGLFTIGIVREDDFSDAELDRLQKWSLKNPENHISLFLQPDKRSGKLLIGKSWIEKFDAADVKEKVIKANLLFEDEQYLKGVDFLVNFIRARL